MQRRFEAVVVQMARLGDIMQSWPLIATLNERYGTGSVAMVVDDRLSCAAALMVGEGQVIAVPVNRLLRSGVGGPAALWRGLSPTASILRNINARRVFNLNYHPPAAALAEMIPAHQRLGAALRDVVAGVIPDGPMGGLFGANWGIRRGKRHIADVWRDLAGPSTAGLKPLPIPTAAHNRAMRALISLGVPADVKPVAVIIGSGNRTRRWGTARWRRLVRALAGEAPVLLIGSSAEAPLAEEVGCGMEDLIEGGRLFSLCGALDLDGLAALVKMCRLVMGVDTGGLHLAAAAGAPCLGIYFGSMNYWETGPYGTGNIVLAPVDPEYPCREADMERLNRDWGADIPAESVINAARESLKGARLTNPNGEVHLSRFGQNGLYWVKAPPPGRRWDATDAAPRAIAENLPA